MEQAINKYNIKLLKKLERVPLVGFSDIVPYLIRIKQKHKLTDIDLNVQCYTVLRDSGCVEFNGEHIFLGATGARDYSLKNLKISAKLTDKGQQFLDDRHKRRHIKFQIFGFWPATVAAIIFGFWGIIENSESSELRLSIERKDIQIKELQDTAISLKVELSKCSDKIAKHSEARILNQKDAPIPAH